MIKHRHAGKYRTKKGIVKRKPVHIHKKPFTGNIEQVTLKNPYFRKVLYTGDREQLVVMSIPKKGDIGNEVHDNVDQFIRVEDGDAKFVFDNGKEVFKTGGSGAVIIPRKTWHNVVNVGDKPLKLYTVYSPPNHPDGTIDKTKKDAMNREKEEH